MKLLKQALKAVRDESNNEYAKGYAEAALTIGGDWFQWGGTESELFETMDIVNKLNETLNENFFEELASEEEDKE